MVPTKGKNHQVPCLHCFFGRLWCKSTFWGDGVKLLVSSYQGTYETPFLLKTLIGAVPIGRCGRKCEILTQKLGYLGQQVNFFVLDSRLLSTGHITSIPWTTTFPFEPPPKKNPFPS